MATSTHGWKDLSHTAESFAQEGKDNASATLEQAKAAGSTIRGTVAIAGVLVLLAGNIVLGLGLVDLLSWEFNELPLWGWFGIVAGGAAFLGAILYTCVRPESAAREGRVLRNPTMDAGTLVSAGMLLGSIFLGLMLVYVMSWEFLQLPYGRSFDIAMFGIAGGSTVFLGAILYTCVQPKSAAREGRVLRSPWSRLTKKEFSNG